MTRLRHILATTPEWVLYATAFYAGIAITLCVAVALGVRL